MGSGRQPNVPGPAPERPGGEEQLITRLAEEYKILQDKIDKIGAFRFTIKGWSITVIIASLFAGTATNSIPPFLLILCLFLVLCLFFAVEKGQINLSHQFGQRTITVEAVLSRILRRSRPASAEFVALRFIPGIAHHLGRQRQHNPKSRLRFFWGHRPLFLLLSGDRGDCRSLVAQLCDQTLIPCRPSNYSPRFSAGSGNSGPPPISLGKRRQLQHGEPVSTGGESGCQWCRGRFPESRN